MGQNSSVYGNLIKETPTRTRGGCYFSLQPLHKGLDTTNMEQLITPLTTLGHLAQLAPEQFAAPLKSLVANFIVKDLLMNDRVGSSDAERRGFYKQLGFHWLCVCLHMRMTVCSVLDRCRVRRQPSCGLPMTRCLQKLWPRSEAHLGCSYA